MPSISLLNKIQQGTADLLKALKVLLEKVEISTDLILMVDKIYLQNTTQYQAGEYAGVDEEGNLYKAVVAFMVVGLKQLTPFVVQAIREVTFNGQWLCDKFACNIENLGTAGFCARGRVADNHSSNIDVFTSLKDLFNSKSKLFLSIQLTMGSERACFLIPLILLRTCVIIY